jgi:murein DD-endopeptidase MepM/ murein hydrolase activator NlpD
MGFDMDDLFNNFVANTSKPNKKRPRSPRGPRAPQRRADPNLGNAILKAAHQAQRNKSPIATQSNAWRMAGFNGIQSPIRVVYRISTQFGPRIHPITGRHSDHTGMDLAAPGGTPVYAPGDSLVDKSGWDNVYGNQIVLGLGEGDQSMFGHLDRSIVKPGQKVRRGDIIGYVGSTGLSTGPHLHWETWVNGQPTNPAKFL